MSVESLTQEFEAIRAAGGVGDDPPGAAELGHSREGRPVRGWRFGRGDVRISLVAGCHADEPVGPAFLRTLARALGGRADEDPLLVDFEWWIVPHANPDGEARNAAWSVPLGDAVDPVAYLTGAVRELPGDDVEFGFPRDAGDEAARPENRALADWWRSADAPFHLHASLHGMAVAHGPWFLMEQDWAPRSESLQRICAAATASLGYELHDVDRGGDKGFWRIGPGFTTRPDSREMARYFRDHHDEATASRFRPSSMEMIRSLGGAPLTLVSEMPLLLLPPRHEPTPATSRELTDWHGRLGAWQQRILAGEGDAVRDELHRAGIRAMPVAHQMLLQWTMIRAGAALVG
ncbi:MAG: peptidase M14 [Gemmatimonadota bacterium]|nr:MAG: peptidase M14 [Gemmatimonadota bacterium]